MLQIVLQIVAQALFFAVPAYATNAFPPLLHGKKPLDRGRLIRNHRILGDSKTVEGTAGGIIFGIVIGVIEIYVRDSLPEGIISWYTLPPMNISLVILLSVGAMAGDILGSFIKRRLNMPPGACAPILDQLGFIVLALVFAAPIYVLPFESIIFLIAFTLILHKLINHLGFILKVKSVPW